MNRHKQQRWTKDMPWGCFLTVQGVGGEKKENNLVAQLRRAISSVFPCRLHAELVFEGIASSGSGVRLLLACQSQQISFVLNARALKTWRWTAKRSKLDAERHNAQNITLWWLGGSQLKADCRESSKMWSFSAFISPDDVFLQKINVAGTRRLLSSQRCVLMTKWANEIRFLLISSEWQGLWFEPCFLWSRSITYIDIMTTLNTQQHPFLPSFPTFPPPFGD